jgi:hypothetical protein
MRWPRDTLCPQNFALTSPTSGGRSVGIVRSWTKATEFSLDSLARSIAYTLQTGKCCGRKRSWYYLVPEGICLEGLRKTMRNSVSMIGVLVHVRTRHLPNATQKHYHLKQRPRWFSCIFFGRWTKRDIGARGVWSDPKKSLTSKRGRAF